MHERERVNGPYPHGRQWRAKLTPPPSDGSSRYRCFATREECQAYIDEFNRQTDGRSIGAAVTEYLQHLATRGGVKKREPLRKSTLASIRFRLVALLRLADEDKPLAAVTPAHARRWYAQRVKEAKPDTHRGELSVALQFFDWTTLRGWTKANPFEGVEPEGSLSEGKRTLSIDHSRRFMATCWEEDTAESLAAMLLLLLGLRASELADRLVADLDDNGRVLVVPRGKSRAARRALVVPEFVRGRLAAQARGKAPEARLFQLSRYALHYHVKRLCKLAGVPEVCPHGLRGSAATNALEVGGNLSSVSRALGHETTAVTLRHYIAPGTIESAEAARRAELLRGNFLGTPAVGEFPEAESQGEEHAN